MSKHEKQLKRERRKADRGRRSWGLKPQASSLKPAGAALAAAAAIAAGTSAYADPIRYNNPVGEDHFNWPVAPGNQWLDITLPALSQPADPYNLQPGMFSQNPVSGAASVVHAGGNGELQVGGYGDYFLQGVDAGDLIPSGLAWRHQNMYICYYGYGGSLLPNGQQTYLGVRFDLGGGWQYGWIGVRRDGLELDAFAWGYETEVGVPIAAGVPEPGTLAMLAVGAVGILRRRRRA